MAMTFHGSKGLTKVHAKKTFSINKAYSSCLIIITKHSLFLTYSFLFCPFFSIMKNITKAEFFRVLLADNKLIILSRNLVLRLWPWQLLMDKNETKKMRGKLSVPGKVIFILCIASFFAGSFLTSRTWTHPLENKEGIPRHGEKLSVASQNCDHKRVSDCFLFQKFCTPSLKEFSHFFLFFSFLLS